MSEQMQANQKSPEFGYLPMIEFGPDDVFISDLDRTLIKSDNLTGFVYDALRASQPDKKASIDVVAANELDNKSKAYEYLRLLTEQGVRIDPEELAEQIVSAHTNDSGEIDEAFINQVMTQGAIKLLETVRDTGCQILLMTAGDELTQRFKLAVVQKIAEQCGIGIDGWIIVAEGKYPKADMVLDCFDDATGRYSFDAERLESNPHVRSFMLAASLSSDRRVAPIRRALVFDDKLFHLTPHISETSDPEDTTSSKADDTMILRTKKQGALRLVHSVAAGMEDQDTLPRTSADYFADRIYPAA